MHDWLLTILVVIVASRNNVEHHGTRTKVERHVITQHPTLRHHHRMAHAPRLDMTVSNVGVRKTARDSPRIAPQTALTNNVREIVGVCNVINRVIAHCAKPSTFSTAAISGPWPG